MSKAKWILAGMATLSALTLAACSSNNNNSSQPTTSVKMPLAYSAKGSADKNGVIKAAEVNDAPFKGISDVLLQDNTEDQDVFSPGIQDLFNTDKNYNFVNGGPADIKVDKNKKTVTITLRKNLKWSNGDPVTAKDVEYAQEVVGNKDSKSQQFSSNTTAMVGMAAYHAGKAKSISGIDLPDGDNGRKVVMHFTSMSPAMTHAGNGFFQEYAEPYKQLKNVPIGQLGSSEQEREHPLYYGPYKIDKIVEGESTSWSPNKYYWGSKPKAKGVTINVVSTSAAASAFKSHKYDFTVGITGIANSDYPQVKKLSDYTNVGTPQLGYGYLGFMVGHMDTKKGVNVMDKDSKVENKSLRQAIAYAMNIDQVEKKFANGLGERATTLIPSGFSEYHDKNAKGFPYNLKKAESLLDKAGYKKHGKWRETPDGKPLVLHFAAMKSSSIHEQTIQNYLQQWHKIGLNVQLTNGKTMEMNAFYSAIQAPKPPKDVDFFEAAWSTGTEPTPQMYMANSPFNMGHFATAKNTELINDLNNSKAFKDSYRKNAFDKWQEYMNQQAAYVPENESLNWTPVNHRVIGFTESPAHANTLWDELGVTANNPK